MWKTNTENVNNMLKRKQNSTPTINMVVGRHNYPQLKFLATTKKLFSLNTKSSIHILTPLIVLINFYI